MTYQTQFEYYHKSTLQLVRLIVDALVEHGTFTRPEMFDVIIDVIESRQPCAGTEPSTEH